MKNLTKIADSYKTDKGSLKHNYTKEYEKYFEPLRNKKIKLLEIGVDWGYSARTWLEYFPEGEIYGMDIVDKHEIKSGRFHFFLGDQSEERDLIQVLPGSEEKFDIIIDDGSHRQEDHQFTLSVLWDYLKRGGFYIIEDLNCKRTPNLKFPKVAVKTIDLLKSFNKDGNFGSVVISEKDNIKLEDEILLCDIYNDKICFLRK